jgi:hypothetical protein
MRMENSSRYSTAQEVADQQKRLNADLLRDMSTNMRGVLLWNSCTTAILNVLQAQAFTQFMMDFGEIS